MVESINQNIYLNDKTDLYKIYDEYGMSDEKKISNFIEICEDTNKLSVFIREPLKSYIKKNHLLHVKEGEIYVKINDKGFSKQNLDDLNKMTNKLVKSLLYGIMKNNPLQLKQHRILQNS
jgi:hypothetical protein